MKLGCGLIFWAHHCNSCNAFVGSRGDRSGRHEILAQFVHHCLRVLKNKNFQTLRCGDRSWQTVILSRRLHYHGQLQLLSSSCKRVPSGAATVAQRLERWAIFEKDILKGHLGKVLMLRKIIFPRKYFLPFWVLLGLSPLVLTILVLKPPDENW